MGTVVEYVKNLWPLSVFVYDDLKASDRIVRKLPIPERTKRFVYAIQEPVTESVIYILSVQNFSERSALDVECLIRELKPDAVIVEAEKLSNSDVTVLQKGGNLWMKNNKSCEDDVGSDDYAVPTSSFGVLKECFMRKVNREKYEALAGSLVLKEIFGVNFNGNLLAAKKAAEEVGSSFLMVESPLMKCSTSGDDDCHLEPETEVVKQGSGFQSMFFSGSTNLVPGVIRTSVGSRYSRAFPIADGIQSQAIKSLSSHLFHLNSAEQFGSEDVRPVVDYEVPQFAKSIYPLLVDLHDIFFDIPSMRTALSCAQKMLSDVNNGEMIDSQILSDVYAFQIAVEGLRIALNNTGRLPMNKIRSSGSSKCDFSEIPVEEKSHAILAQALQIQAKKYKSVVAVVNANELAGLRKHWKTILPSEVDDMVEQLVMSLGKGGEFFSFSNQKLLLAEKPVVAVGAGATAILGAASLSKVVPASTLMKIATFHIPSSVQIILSQTQKAVFFALSKALGPTKMAVPVKTTVVKAAASAEKIRAVAHGVIAHAEKTSLSAMRTAFYEIMRKRRVRPVGVMPWATFGCSIATCAGLVVYGDGIECAAESIPAAPSIASLGRGIESLRQVSQVVKHTESSRIQNSIETLLHKFKKIAIQ